ncbi:Rab11 family-interacting protein 3 [Tupaia chinensis]|uniref:Rab11 family-interacting protein 3 n=1 Tax=Tupaia chinensis TaxID=246437 RepID=L9KXT6_TUPCH|nr:Rab11 family-interacting protein 3 [Tupaia chinensis]
MVRLAQEPGLRLDPVWRVTEQHQRARTGRRFGAKGRRGRPARLPGPARAAGPNLAQGRGRRLGQGPEPWFAPKLPPRRAVLVPTAGTSPLPDGSRLRAVFDALDRDGDGFVRIEDFVQFATVYGAEQEVLLPALPAASAGPPKLRWSRRGQDSVSSGRSALGAGGLPGGSWRRHVSRSSEEWASELQGWCRVHLVADVGPRDSSRVPVLARLRCLDWNSTALRGQQPVGDWREGLLQSFPGMLLDSSSQSEVPQH